MHTARRAAEIEPFEVMDVLSRAQALEVRMDVFNLLNATNVTQVNAVYGRVVGSPAATFMQPTRVANPRQLQFAARYRF